jgi:hypothetical protein
MNNFRYVPALQGILLAHDNLHFMSSSATIKGDCPFANCTVSFDATVWSPRIGMKLGAIMQLLSRWSPVSNSILKRARLIFALLTTSHSSFTAPSTFRYLDIIYLWTIGSLNMVLQKTTPSMEGMFRAPRSQTGLMQKPLRTPDVGCIG